MPQISTIMQPWGSLSGDLTEHLLHFRVSSLTIATAGHPQQLVNGYLEPMDGTVAGDEVAGVAQETVTGDTSSTLCAIYTDPNLIYSNDADGVLTFAAVGQTFRILANTGQVDASTGTLSSNQPFVLVRVDPYNENDMSAGLFKVYTNLWTSNAQT